MINYAPKLRVTPPAGPQLNYDLATIAHLTRAAVYYDRLAIDREFLDRSVGQKPIGYIVRAEIQFTVPAVPTADQATLAEILAHFSNPDAVAELSMGNDEFGAARYRQVGQFTETQGYEQDVLSVAIYTWTVRCTGLIPAPLAPGLGAVAVW